MLNILIWISERTGKKTGWGVVRGLELLPHIRTEHKNCTKEPVMIREGFENTAAFIQGKCWNSCKTLILFFIDDTRLFHRNKLQMSLL